MLSKGAQGEADLVTKYELQIEFAPIKSDLLLAKWMTGLILGGIIVLVLEAFFPV